MIICPETPEDIQNIRDLVTSAFEDAPHSDRTEAFIVDGLREAGALTISLVVVQADRIVGHVAFSPVAIEGAGAGWYGLGPVAVHPDYQKTGIGTKLIEAGLAKLKALSASGCVVLGDPQYYARFNFKCDPALVFRGAPVEYFQCLDFTNEPRHGTVFYHEAFYGA
ncbi:hypothetical protein ACI0FR_01968 [Paenochrobactrum sp. BZR 201-1]